MTIDNDRRHCRCERCWRGLHVHSNPSDSPTCPCPFPAHYDHTYPLLTPFVSITFLHIQLQMGSAWFLPGNYLSGLLALFSLLSTETLLSECLQQKANGSPEIMDVFVLNPSISSFNAEQPKTSYRRELLLRTLQQRQHQHRTLSSSLLTRQRPARPYSQPVPKAKAIPGPILAKNGAKNLLNSEKLMQTTVNSQSTVALLDKANEERKLQLVNGGGDEDSVRRSQEHSNEVLMDTTARPIEEDEGEQPRFQRFQPRTAYQEKASLTNIDLRYRSASSRTQGTPIAALSLDSQPEQQQQLKKPLAKSFGQPQQKWVVPYVGSRTSLPLRVNQQGANLAKLQPQSLPQTSAPQQVQPRLYFYYTPSQTTVNQDFTFARDTPGFMCAYGVPVPVYNTPRKQCIPYSPLCGLAFTCLMDVHAVDERGQTVDNWWTLEKGASIAGQTTGGGGHFGDAANGQVPLAIGGGIWRGG